MTVSSDAGTPGEPGSPGPARATADLTAGQAASLAQIIESSLHRRLDRPLSVSLLSGGRSNLTYRLSAGGEQWVMRRPPLGHVLETAHDMHREYRVMHALAPTAVPVPGTVCYIDDRSVLGAEFFVMNLVDGVVYRTAEEMAALSPAQARTLSYTFIDSMADLHQAWTTPLRRPPPRLPATRRGPAWPSATHRVLAPSCQTSTGTRASRSSSSP